MASTHDTVTFLSDYGLDDEFVGVCRSILRELAPHAEVIDLSHGVAPHDVRAGSLTLARAVQYIAPGVVLGVVDPGVGTSRRGVAVEVLEGRAVFVGPDNGLLAPAVAVTGGAGRAVVLDGEGYRLDAPGLTFDGRDLFAPAAAQLCNGVDLSELGTEIDPALLTPAIVPVPRVQDDTMICEVLWVDRFGNCQLNVGPEEVEVYGDTVTVSWGDDVRVASRAAAYGELAGGRLGLVTDSYGVLSLSFDRRSAADELGLGEGDEVIVAEAT